MASKLDRYTRARIFLDLVDQANGLPAGTTKVGTLTIEDYQRMAGEMARTAVVMQWGVVGVIGAMLAENEDLNAYKYRKMMPFYDYPWGRSLKTVSIVESMYECGCKPSLLTQPEVAHIIFHNHNRVVQIPDAHKRDLWNLVVLEGWHTTLVKRMIKKIEEAYSHAGDRAEEIAKICVEAARRLHLHGKRRNFDDLAPVDSEDVSGEGAGTPSGSE